MILGGDAKTGYKTKYEMSITGHTHSRVKTFSQHFLFNV